MLRFDVKRNTKSIASNKETNSRTRTVIGLGFHAIKTSADIGWSFARNKTSTDIGSSFVGAGNAVAAGLFGDSNKSSFADGENERELFKLDHEIFV